MSENCGNEMSPDEFYAGLLENFKNRFDDDAEYSGADIKQRISGLILRII